MGVGDGSFSVGVSPPFCAGSSVSLPVHPARLPTKAGGINLSSRLLSIILKRVPITKLQSVSEKASHKSQKTVSRGYTHTATSGILSEINQKPGETSRERMQQIESGEDMPEHVGSNFLETLAHCSNRQGPIARRYRRELPAVERRSTRGPER